MGESTGTVYADIRIALDKLQADIAKTGVMFKQVEDSAKKTATGTQNNFSKMTKDTTAGLEKLSNTGVGQMAKMAKGMQSAIMAAPIVGVIMMIIGLIVKAVSMFTQWREKQEENVKVTIEHQKEVAKLNAVVESTGATAWTTTRQLTGLAKQVSQETGAAVNDIMAMQSVLLGFRNITGEAFDRTTRAIVDMAAVMGGDLASAANSVGKALDTPVEGMGALAKQGFVFTQQEKLMVAELMRAGNVMEAQNVILNAMEESFQGVAAAVSEVEQAQNRLNNAEERLARAQGERDAASVSRRQNRKARRREDRAERIEIENAIRDASNRSYEAEEQRWQSMQERLNGARQSLQALKDELETTTDEAKRFQIQMEIATEEANLLTQRDMAMTVALELYTQKYEDDITNAQKMYSDIFVQMGYSGTHALQKINKRMEETGESWNDAARSVMRSYGISAEYLDSHTKKLLEQAEIEMAGAQRRLDWNNQQLEAHQKQAAEAIRLRQAEAAELEQLRLADEAINDVIAQRERTLEEIARAEQVGLMSAEQAAQARASAYQAEANMVNQITTNINKMAFTSVRGIQMQGEMMERVNTQLTQATVNWRALHDEIAAGPRRVTAAEFNTRLTSIETALRNNENALRSMREQGIIDEEKYQAELLSARQAAANSSQALLRETGVVAQGNPGFYARISALNTLADTETERAKNLAEVASAEEKLGKTLTSLQDDYVRLTGTIEEITALERQRAWEGIENSAEYQAIVRAEERARAAAAIETNEEIRAQLEATADAHRQTLDDIETAFNRVHDHVSTKNMWEKATAFAQQYGQSIGDVINSFANLYATMIQKTVEKELKALDKLHKAQLDYLEKEKQAKLYAKGFIEAQTEEQHQRELELAIESGDQQRIFAAQNAYEKFQIEEEFEKQKEALDKEMAQKKAQLDHKAAMAQWHTQLLGAIVSGAQAIAMAGVNMWPVPAVPMMALAGTTTAAQIAVIAANKPQMQTFAGGGIVGGNSFRGDRNIIGADTDEMFLNRRQQRNLFDRIDGNDMGIDQITIHNYLNVDGLIVAKSTVKHINNRQAGLIEGRSVLK